MKKLPVIVISLLLVASSLLAQQIKLYVKEDKTVIYAEPNENSYKIDTVKSGTVLTLFEKGIESAEWIYVTFESQRWKGKVTGFIKADLVFTEEEMLREEQRRMEEETPEETAAEAEEAKEADLKEGEETKPQEELPDMKAAFAKKKPEKAETESPESVKKEVLEETPQAKEINTPEAKVEEAEEFKRPEPQPPVITIKDGITESPQGRAIAVTQIAKMAEMRPYATIKREFKPPPSQLKAGEKIEEEAQTELQTDVLAVKVEEPPPGGEEKEILEEAPQAKEIDAPEEGISEEEEFQKPEPPPPIVTVMDGITESPRGRAFVIIQVPEMAEPRPYAIIKREFKPPPSLLKAGEKIEEEAQTELQTDVMAVKVDERPQEETEVPDEEKVKVEQAPSETKKEEVPSGEEKEEPQIVKPTEQVVKPPEQVLKPTELAKPKEPGEVGFLSFGFGYGPSWGGLGGAVQLNINKNISIHIGAGLYPTKTYYSEYTWATNEWLYSVGIKYYLPFGGEALRTYLDLMYGGISVEAVQLVKEIWYYEYTFENIQKTLYGPTLVAGADLKLGFLGLNGYLGLSYNTTAWDYWDRDYFLNGGLGFSLYF
jgi:hypothetical protein